MIFIFDGIDSQNAPLVINLEFLDKIYAHKILKLVVNGTWIIELHSKQYIFFTILVHFDWLTSFANFWQVACKQALQGVRGWKYQGDFCAWVISSWWPLVALYSFTIPTYHNGANWGEFIPVSVLEDKIYIFIA